MADNNMTLIQAVTVGAGGAANIEFTSIPQTYTDLILKVTARTNGPGNYDNLSLEFNNSTASNYSSILLYGLGTGTPSSASQQTVSGIRYTGYGTTNNVTSNTFSNIDIYIPNYTSSNAKSILVDGVTENNTTDSLTGLTAGLWSLTNSVTSIKLYPTSASSFVQYTTAYLYGVSSAAVGAKATGGNIISQDADYFYHIFTSSGTFTPTQSLTADYLVVAGGGGGGWQVGAGGGAGGLRCTVGATGGGGSLETPLSLTAQAYTVTIGAGGAGGSGGSRGVSGSNSVFSTITSIAGGGGGSGAPNTNGLTGGSGGGGGNNNGEGGSAGAGTANQGYAGAATTGGRPGGGGGAGAIGGSSPSLGTGGNGGVGVLTTISSGVSTYFAGGGGAGARNDGGATGSGTGGTGGSGGGGNGGAVGNNGSAGTTNTGGGGGGGGYTDNSSQSSGGAGGSGIVIVRYAK